MAEINKNTAELLKKYIEGVEMYEDQKKEISSSIKEIFDEAKSADTHSSIDSGGRYRRSSRLSRVTKKQSLVHAPIP